MFGLSSLIVGVALAAEPAPIKRVGHSISGGQSPLTITVTDVEDDRKLIEVYWDAFHKTSLEQVFDTTTACAADDLAGGKALIGEVSRCANVRLDDVHPVYEYTDKTRVRCVFGGSEGKPSAACKLQYSGWFALETPPDR